VVIDHIHHDVDPCLVEALNHLLEFLDSGVAIFRIGGIDAFEAVVVERIVAPVERLGFASSLS
jgi:hypothetical protein